MQENTEVQKTNMQILLEKDALTALQSQNFLSLISEITLGKNDPENPDIKKTVANILQTVRNNTDLLKCTTKSIIYSIITSIQLNLPVDSRNLAYLVSFRQKQKDGTFLKVCSFMPGYQGYIKLIKEDEDVDNVQSEIIYECDEFKTWDDENGRHFTLIPNYRERQKSKIAFIMAIVRYKNNTGRSPQFEVISYEEAKKCMPTNRESDFWTNYEKEMLRKTAVRRLGKWYVNRESFARLNSIDTMQDINNNEVYCYVNENGEVIREQIAYEKKIPMPDFSKTKDLETQQK